MLFKDEHIIIGVVGLVAVAGILFFLLNPHSIHSHRPRPQGRTMISTQVPSNRELMRLNRFNQADLDKLELQMNSRNMPFSS